MANPGNPILQEDIAGFMKIAHGLDEREGRKLSFLYRKSGINTRFSVLTDFEKANHEDFEFFPKSKNLEPFPSTKSRMGVFTQEAPRLCYAAFTGLKLADKIIRSDSQAKVLVVTVELCTLHFQKDYLEDNILANSLFGDGAAAALVSSSPSGLAIKSYLSRVLREGEQDMAWGIGDFGFEMKLTKYIPSLLDGGIQQLKAMFEDKFNLSKIKNFAIHPGGMQILAKVQEAFGLGKEVNFHAMEVLKQFGNMSSSLVLFVLSRMMKDVEIEGDILSMGFGPGLTLETLLLEKA